MKTATLGNQCIGEAQENSVSFWEKDKELLSYLSTEQFRSAVWAVVTRSQLGYLGVSASVMSSYEDKDHAKVYADFRPDPPPQLIDKLLHFLSEKQNRRFKLAVDVGCGSGQATDLLAPHFDHVVGIDNSPAQIQQAYARNIHSNVQYSVKPASTMPVADESVDLVFVCEAIHWFDLDTFYQEVERVLAPNGILAVAGYMYPEPIYKEFSGDLFDVVQKLFQDNRHLWPEKHGLLIDRYRNLNLPYGPVTRVDPIAYDIKGSFANLLGHIRSRSGIQSLRQKNPEAAEALMTTFVQNVKDIIKSESLPEDIPMVIRFNYFLVMTRKSFNVL